MRFCIMRHGATAANEAHRYLGRATDEPLSELGRRQCRQAGVAPAVQTVYVSPLARARASAKICFPAARIVPVAGLEEMDFGAFEGRTADEMAADTAYRAWVEGGCTGSCPAGESRASFAARSNAALAGVLRAALANGDRDVVVVAHGGTIMAAFQAFADAAAEGIRGYDDYFCWQVGPAEGYAASVRAEGNTWAFTDVTHFTRLPAWL